MVEPCDLTVVIVDDNDDKRVYATMLAQKAGFLPIQIQKQAIEFDTDPETVAQNVLLRIANFEFVLIILDGTWTHRGEEAAKNEQWAAMDCVCFLQKLAQILPERRQIKTVVVMDSNFPPRDFSVFPKLLTPVNQGANSLQKALAQAKELFEKM